MKKQSFAFMVALSVLLALAGCGKGGGVSSSSSASKESSSSSAGGASSSKGQESSSASSSDTEGSSSTSSSSESSVPSHVHHYGSDHLCPDDGYSEPGYFPIDVDGEVDDSKWGSFDKYHKLSHFASDGRGFEVKAFADAVNLYFAFDAKTSTSAIALAELVINGTHAYSVSFDSVAKTYSHSEGVLTGVVKQIEGTLIETKVEGILPLAQIPDSASGLKIGFDINVPSETSELSFSSTQPDFWVLHGTNSWDAAHQFVTDASGISHTHFYGTDGNCIYCGDPIPEGTFKIHPDGDLSDWSETVSSHAIRHYDSDGRMFGFNAFFDDQFLYVNATLIHVSAHIDQLLLLYLPSGASGASENVMAVPSGSGYAFKGPGMQAGGFHESVDSVSGLTTSVFEFVVTRSAFAQNDGKVNLGWLAWLPSQSDSNSEFDINHTGAPGYWGITASHNAWGPGGRFDITENGLLHDHIYGGDDCCILCGAKKPDAGVTYAVTFDGDLSDWDSAILATEVHDSDTAGFYLGVTGFLKEDYVYVAFTLKHIKPIDALEMVCDDNATTPTITPSGSGYVASSHIAKLAFKNSEDQLTGLITTVFEFALPLAKMNNVAKMGFNVRSQDESTALGYVDQGSKWWVIHGINPWDASKRFTFTSTGLVHVHQYENGTCVICGASDPSKG
jgi:hypothetical protein